MSSNLHSGDLGFCRLVGHSGTVTLTWEGNTVVNVECGFGDPKTCEYSSTCELYNRRPVGFIQTYPIDEDSPET